MKKHDFLSKLLPTAFILLSALFSVSAMAQQYITECYGIRDGSMQTNSLSFNGYCGAASLPHNVDHNPDRYKLQENFIPQPTDPVKTIRMRFIVLQNSTTPGSTGNFENTAAHLQFFDSLVYNVNYKFGNIKFPEDPQYCVCGNACYLADTRIRVELEGIDFVVDPILYGQDSGYYQDQMSTLHGTDIHNTLNVFFVGNGVSNGTIGGSSNGLSYYPDDYDNSIYLQNYHSNYEDALTYYGNAQGITSALGSNLFHEVGHTLGLKHIYTYGASENSYPLGHYDYLEDIYGSGTTSCPSIPFPVHGGNCYTGPDQTCFVNWMGGYSLAASQKEASPMQIGRAHRNTMLTSSRNLIKVSSSLAADHLITSDETWDFSIRMYSNIVVKSGAKLTLRCEVFMPPGGNIYVEPGAELIVDGGTITSFTDDYLWGGIQVEGDNTQSQLEYNGVQYQGKATFKNGALIENARHAVTNWKVNDWGSPGGIIQAENTTFRNNLRSVEFMAYENFSPTTQSVIKNLSSFKYCTFEHTQPLNTGESPIAMVTLWQVRGVQFNACTFQSSIENNQHEGIYSIDAGYVVEDVCVGGTAPCSSNSMDRSHFTNLFRGVVATGGAGSAYKVSVMDCEFTDCVAGVIVDAQNDVSVKGNSFSADNVFAITGVYVNAATGYEVYGNTFSDDGAGALTGAWVQNSGYALNAIENNTFNAIQHSIITQGDNFEYSNQTVYQGLKYFCNDINNSTYNDIYVGVGKGASIYQGHSQYTSSNTNTSPSSSAANLFTANYSPYHYNNNATIGLVTNYYYDDQLIREKPTQNQNTNTVLSVEHDCDEAPDDNLEKLSTAELQQSDYDYDIWKVIFDDRLLLYYNELDGGDYDDLITTIESSYAQDALDLRDELMANSPLSYEAFMAALNQDILSNALLYEVLSVNTDLMKIDDVITALETKNDPMPAYMISSLVDASTTPNFKEQLILELGSYQHERDLAYKQMLNHYYPLENEGDQAELETWIAKHEGEFSGKMRAVQHLLALQESSEAESTITNWINVAYGVEAIDNQRDEYVTFLGEYLSAFYDNGAISWPVDTPYFATLDNYVSSADYVASNAQNILRYNNMEVYTLPDLSFGEGQKTNHQSKYTQYLNGTFIHTGDAASDVEAKLYPNPSSNGQVTLELEGMNSDATYTYRLLDNQSRVISKGNVTSPRTPFSFKVESGIYFFELYEGEQHIQTIRYTNL
ncbi:MAG: hypothetical protein CL843_07455 [Crocinitomicaceae bacterium]|nr:hypothetical protein [Crocinitomicaceae bacterium]|tara:strand:- start:326 stop:3988 length:3663 start_codon:yes stop_codon:yes gene_type:complete